MSRMKRGKGETYGRKTGSVPVYVTPLFTVGLSACGRRLGSHSSVSAKSMVGNAYRGEQQPLLSHPVMVPSMGQDLTGAGCPA